MASSSEVILDVRPVLEAKQDPFEQIMATVKQLEKDQVLVLHATFKPTPLLTMMKLKGYRSVVNKLESNHWVVKFVHKSHAHLLGDDPTDENQEVKSEEAGVSPGADVAHLDSHADGLNVYTLDNRGLEPPQPMMRTLNQLKNMQTGDRLTITNDRVPAFLLDELRQLGYPFEIEHLEGGAARVTIEKR